VAFRKLVALDPTRDLSGDYAPRVQTPFFEARSWVAEHGALSFVGLKPTRDENNIQAVNAGVKSDVFGLAQRVRFHVRPTGGPWNVLEQPLTGGQARARMEAPSVEWWAELLGANDGILEQIGSESAPVKEEIGRPAVLATPRLDVVPREKEPEGPAILPTSAPTAEAHRTSESGPSFRPLAYTLLGAGAVSLGVGSYYGLRSAGDLSQINSAAKDPSGTITGISQSKAYQLNQDAASSATLANIMWGAGAGVVVVGAIIWLAGREPADDHLSVLVSPSGVGIAGTLP